MIILSDLRGQLCNRIFLTAYGLALQNKTGQAFIDFSLDKYASLFPRTRRSKWLEIPYKLARYATRAVVKILWHSRIGRVFIIELNRDTTAELSPDQEKFIARLKRRPLTFIRVTTYPRLNHLRLPDIPIIRETFDPGPEVAAQVREHARKARGDADVLIGLHIRRGDYDIHLGGRHFYPVEFYREAMDAAAGLFPGKKIAFLLCSNEPQPMEIFVPHRVTLGLGTVLGDLYGLSECDYILGPPSTFSLWAAYYARKPIHLMCRREVPRSLGQFMVPDGHFECYDLDVV